MKLKSSSLQARSIWRRIHPYLFQLLDICGVPLFMAIPNLYTTLKSICNHIYSQSLLGLLHHLLSLPSFYKAYCHPWSRTNSSPYFKVRNATCTFPCILKDRYSLALRVGIWISWRSYSLSATLLRCCVGQQRPPWQVLFVFTLRIVERDKIFV